MSELKAIELQDTAEMMTSPDYKERFKAEYYQLEIRYGKLAEMLKRLAAGTLDFTPTCPIELLEEQAAHMVRYMRCLEERAKLEGITL